MVRRRLERRAGAECLHTREPSMSQGEPATSEDLHHSHQASERHADNFDSLPFPVRTLSILKESSGALSGGFLEANRWGVVEWRMDGRQMQLALVQRGRKRHADDNLENEQRLAKRFNSLKLGMPMFAMVPRSVLMRA